MHVSYHAQKRYWLRVDATCKQPDHIIRTMWNEGRDASLDDFSIYHVEPEPIGHYRIGKSPNGLNFMIAARGNVIVTLLDLRY